MSKLETGALRGMLLTLAVLAAGCGEGVPSPEGEPAADATADERDAAAADIDVVELHRVDAPDADTTALPQAELARARETATALATNLAQLVFSTLEAEGPVATVQVCSEIAQERTAEFAAEGVYVRRISDRLRNPLNAPDADEAREIERMHALESEGRLPAEILRVIERNGTRQLHLLRPIRIQQPCLACHGAADQLDPDVQRIIAERYPEDRATGYSVGQLRGAVSVRVDVDEPRP
jgi:hypothetical protein